MIHPAHISISIFFFHVQIWLRAVNIKSHPFERAGSSLQESRLDEVLSVEAF